MYIVRAFVGVHGFQVDHVADDVVFVVDAVAAVHVARQAGDVQRLAAAVALDHADHLGQGFSFVHQAAHAQASLQAQRDFGLHVSQFLLNQLVLCEWATKLHAVQGVLASAVPAVFRSTQRAPGDTVAGAVQVYRKKLLSQPLFEIRSSE